MAYTSKLTSKGIFGLGTVVDIIIGCACVVLIIIAISLSRMYFYTKKTDATIQEHASGDYKVLEIRGLLTPQECDEIIAYAQQKGMYESDVLSYGSSSGTEVMDQYRKSKTAWMTDDENPIAMRLALYSEQITGLPRENQEMLQVAFYEKDGKFNEHFDACVFEDKSFCDKMNNNAGQRRSTLLIYLNDDFEGGETEFVNIGLTVKPEKGKAILFWNTDENENIIQESKHRGNPVLSGQKWICTKWSHVGAF
jgi:prolyl 4-hydroxylase